MIPGRPYGLRNEARLIIRRVGREMAEQGELIVAIGGGRKAGSIVAGIQGAVDRAMAKAQDEIGRATDVLVDEIQQGTKMVAAAVRAEAAEVRRQFGEVVDNAAALAEEAVNGARASIEAPPKEPAGEAPVAGAGPSLEKMNLTPPAELTAQPERPSPNGSGDA